jgi:hypothetical protein
MKDILVLMSAKYKWLGSMGNVWQNKQGQQGGYVHGLGFISGCAYKIHDGFPGLLLRCT